MIKNVVQNIGGVGLYGILSLCLFFCVFTGAFIWACFRRRSFCNAMSALPLDDGAVKKGEKAHE